MVSQSGHHESSILVCVFAWFLLVAFDATCIGLSIGVAARPPLVAICMGVVCVFCLSFPMLYARAFYWFD